MAASMPGNMAASDAAGAAIRLPPVAVRLGVSESRALPAVTKRAAAWASGGLLLLALVALWATPGALQPASASGAGAASRSHSEAVLLRQLQQVDAEQEPAAAGVLHVALGRVYLSAGQDDQALWHFAAAREKAELAGGDAGDLLVTTQVALGEVRLQRGNARGAAAELESALGMMGAGSAHEFAATLALARAKSSLGQHDAALRLLKRAQECAASAEERLSALRDLREAQSRSRGNSRPTGTKDFAGSAAPRGEAERSAGSPGASVESSRGPKARTVTSGPMSSDELMEHMRKVSRLGRAMLQKWKKQASAKGSPALRSGRAAKGPPSAAKLRDIVNDLMNSQELKKADAAVVTALDAYQAKEDWMAAATAHNLLGWIRRAQERYPEAARRHMRALALALQAGGPAAAESREAEAAYQGLSFVQASFHYVGRPEQAVALLHEAVAAADAAGVPQDSPGRKWGERRLRANARSAIAAAPAPPRAQGPQASVGDAAEATRLVSV